MGWKMLTGMRSGRIPPLERRAATEPRVLFMVRLFMPRKSQLPVRRAGLLCLVAGAAAMLIPDPALALRCGTRLVAKGDPQAKVLRYCGEPTSVQTRSIVRSGPTRQRFYDRDTDRLTSRSDEVLFFRRSYVEVIVEEWTYNFGPNRLMRIVKFENGLVADVKQLGYGFHE